MECPKCKSIRLVPDKSPKMKFHCHSCGQSVRVAQIHAGKKGICPKCKKLVDIPSHAEGTMVALVCPICNEIIHVPEDSKEHFIECPNCSSYVEGLAKDDWVDVHSCLRHAQACHCATGGSHWANAVSEVDVIGENWSHFSLQLICRQPLQAVISSSISNRSLYSASSWSHYEFFRLIFTGKIDWHFVLVKLYYLVWNH